MMSINVDLSALTFSAAFKIWIETRKRKLKPRVIANKYSYAKALEVVFGPLRLDEIHPGHIREYQGMREANFEGKWNRAAGPSAINHELSMLSEVLHRANLWKKKLAPHYEPLPLPKWTPPRVMDYEGEQKFKDYLPTTETELLAYLVATITNNTSASGCELRGLRLRDVHIYGELCEVRIPDDSVKNEWRARRVPLNKTARSVFEQCIIRANRIGSFAPEHYLFPLRLTRPSKQHQHGLYDPTRPASASWIRCSWRELRKALGQPGLRAHDMRHQFITRALEKGVEEKHLMEITGHISEQMLRHYSHIRMAPKQKLVDLLDSHHAPLARRRMRA